MTSSNFASKNSEMILSKSAKKNIHFYVCLNWTMVGCDVRADITMVGWCVDTPPQATRYSGVQVCYPPALYSHHVLWAGCGMQFSTGVPEMSQGVPRA